LSMPHVCKCGICGATMGWVGLPAVDPTPFSNESALRESGFSAETAAPAMQTCPDCKNQFVQPFKCITCGAEKLYDATVRSQAQRIEALEAVLTDIASGEIGINLCVRYAKRVMGLQSDAATDPNA
jgi:hypothetical protein